MASGSRENPLALLQFPFSAGIDEGNRDELVEPGGGWPVLENGRQDHRGGYSTRNGFAALGNTHVDATSPTSGYKLLSDTATPVRICDGQLEAYSSAANAWQQLGRVPECAARVVGLPSMGTLSYVEDVDATNGYLALCWLVVVGGASVAFSYVSIVDQATGAIVRAPEVVGPGGPLPNVLSVEGKYFIATTNDATGNLKAYYLDTTSAATINTGWVAFGTLLATDSATNTLCVVHSLTTGSGSARTALLYVNNSGGVSQLTCKTFTVAGGVLETQTVSTNSSTPTAFTISGNSSDTLWLAWNEGSFIQALGLSPFAITATALATVATLGGMATGTTYMGIAAGPTGKARLVVNDTNTTTRCKVFGIKTTAGAAALDGSNVEVPNAQMCRKPFYYGGRYYSAFFVGGVTNLQSTFIVCDFTDAVTYVRPIANLAPGLASAGYASLGKFVAGATSSKFFVGFGVAKSTIAVGSAYAELDFASVTRWQPTAWGNSTYLSGGLLSCFDGLRVEEAGFLCRPVDPSGVASGVGAITTTWRYICVYEEVDADGNWHQSGLSGASGVVTLTNNTTSTVTTQPLSVTYRTGATATSRTTRVAFYRTLTGGVAPYYRIGTTINDTTAATVTFVDTVTDAVAQTGAKLYSQPLVVGTSQDKRPPPPFQCVAAYNGMLVGASGSDVWYSGQNVSGEGVWFNPIFSLPVPGDGDITALWAMDGTLFVAKRREIYAINGEAPSDNGSSGGLGLPRRLAVDVGVLDQRSVCLTALGTFFQSDRGIEILTRAQSVDWIGEAVQDTAAAYPVVTSATVEPVSCTVLIECATTEASGLVTGTGRTLVYDLSARAWVSTDRRRDSLGGIDTPSQSACMLYTGTAWRYGWLTAGGVVHYETPGTYLDAYGTIVAKRAISANIKAGGLQGHQHVNRALVLAKYHTPHDLNLSFAYNYSSTYKTARLYTAAQLLTLTTALPNMQLEHPMHDDARCEAVRVQLQDVTPSSGSLGTGQGATWIALAFEVVPQTGAFGLPNVSR